MANKANEESLAIATVSGLLSNQGEQSINFYFIRVPLRKKVLKYGTPKPRYGSAVTPEP